jgi:DnaJ-class molecular chaperone
MTDYYKVLGILPMATAAAIQRAYSLQALKCHSDRNLGDSGVQACFKKMVVTYTGLSESTDSEKLYYVYRKQADNKVIRNHEDVGLRCNLDTSENHFSFSPLFSQGIYFRLLV